MNKPEIEAFRIINGEWRNWPEWARNIVPHEDGTLITAQGGTGKIGDYAVRMRSGIVVLMSERLFEVNYLNEKVV